MGGEMTKTRIYLESLVIVAIVASLAQIFLDDLSVLAGWSWNNRRILLIAAFALDVFFSVEFLSRLYGAFINRRTRLYLSHERGWVDLIASVPVLLIVSGPAALAYWSGSLMMAGTSRMFAVLTVVKALRVARILRLLRVLKLFSRIRKTDSVMLQRHLAKASTVATAVIVIGTLLVSALFSVSGFQTLEGRYQQSLADLVERVQGLDPQPDTRQLELAALAQNEEPLLVVQRNGRTLYSRHGTDYYERWFGPFDYGLSEREGVRVFFDLRPLNREQARTSMLAFGLVAFLVVFMVLAYGSHFALTVSEPIHAMVRGMSERTYSPEIAVRGIYRTDEVYRLAQLYNDVFLPMKADAEATTRRQV